MAVAGVAIAGAQAGHLLAYELRFGPAAQQLQSTGAHAYFPLLVKTSLGAAALALVGSLFLIGFARLAAGRGIDKDSSPSLLRLVSVLYTVQLALFVVQESIEGGPASAMVLWGLLGQMPVALIGAVALQWLLARLRPAVASIAFWSELVVQPRITTSVVWPAPVPVLVVATPVAGPISRRGPPSSF